MELNGPGLMSSRADPGRCGVERGRVDFESSGPRPMLSGPGPG